MLNTGNLTYRNSKLTSTLCYNYWVHMWSGKVAFCGGTTSFYLFLSDTEVRHLQKWCVTSNSAWTLNLTIKSLYANLKVTNSSVFHLMPVLGTLILLWFSVMQLYVDRWENITEPSQLQYTSNGLNKRETVMTQKVATPGGIQKDGVLKRLAAHWLVQAQKVKAIIIVLAWLKHGWVYLRTLPASPNFSVK